MGGQRLVPLALAGSAVGVRAVREHRSAAPTDAVGAVAVIGLGVTSVVAGGLVLQRVAGPLGGVLAVAVGRAVTTGWSRYDLRAARASAARDTSGGSRSHIRRQLGPGGDTTAG
jgi:hypothetical protein